MAENTRKYTQMKLNFFSVFACISVHSRPNVFGVSV